MKDFGADGVLMLEADQPGPTVAIFAGVHGDEKAGVEALKAVTPSLKLTRGKAYLVMANPPAIAKGKRQLKKNLNRLFKTGPKDKSYEDQRAVELMAILDQCDALLDLHGFPSKDGGPFIICEELALPVATKLDPKLVSIDWAKAEPGATDGYMFAQGKVGICFELGPNHLLNEGKKLGIKTIKQFLKHYDMIADGVDFADGPKRIIKAEYSVVRDTKDYHLENVKNFQKLKTGQVYGSMGGKQFVAEGWEYIIFPHKNPIIGSEAFIIGRQV